MDLIRKSAKDKRTSEQQYIDTMKLFDQNLVEAVNGIKPITYTFRPDKFELQFNPKLKKLLQTYTKHVQTSRGNCQKFMPDRVQTVKIFQVNKVPKEQVQLMENRNRYKNIVGQEWSQSCRQFLN